MSAHDVEDLIESFYEAAAGRVSWYSALHTVAARLDCVLAQIIGVDIRHNRLIFSFEGGNAAPEGVVDYARTYHRLDSQVSHVVPRPPGNLLAFSREFDAEFIERHPFYQDYLTPTACAIPTAQSSTRTKAPPRLSDSTVQSARRP